MGMLTTRRCTRCDEDKPASLDFFGATSSGNLRGFCKQCMNKASREYEKNNKDKRRLRDAKRDSLEGGSRRGFDLATKQSLWKRQNGICPCCFTEIDRPENAQVDHMTPLARGGSREPWNLALTHTLCNQDKHNKTLREHWDWRVKVGLDQENLGRQHGLLSD